MISLLTVALTLTQGLGGLQPGTGIVTGSVRLATGAPAAGVRVAAVPVDDPAGAFLSIAETDSAGRYRLSNIPEGRYYIVAGRLDKLSYYPEGTDKTKAHEVSVGSARITPNINLTALPDSQRPAPLQTPSSLALVQEDIAYREWTLERDVEKKQKLLLNFEKNFPKSPALPNVYAALMEIYIAQRNNDKAAEYGLKALKQDPENVAALVQFSRTRAQQNDLASAMQYAEKAVAAAAKMKHKPQPSSADGAWQSWVAALDASAKSNLAWVKQLQAIQEKTIFSILTRPR